MEAQKRGIVIPVASETLRRDTEWIGRLLRGDPPTAEERRRGEELMARWRRDRAEARVAQAVTFGSADDLVRAVEESQGWPAGYLAHLSQPYCDCGPDRDDGWAFCAHAEDEFEGIGR